MIEGSASDLIKEIVQDNLSELDSGSRFKMYLLLKPFIVYVIDKMSNNFWYDSVLYNHLPYMIRTSGYAVTPLFQMVTMVILRFNNTPFPTLRYIICFT